MTTIDGQLDIFAELDDPAAMVTCPHCGHSWPMRNRTEEEHRDVHTRRNGGPWDDMPGKCENQRMALSWLAARAVPSDVKYRGDLLSSLIDVQRMGVDKAHVLGVLALAEKRMGAML